MLNKFENPEDNLSADDPKFQVMDAWAALDNAYRQNLRQFFDTMQEFDMESFGKKRQDPSFNYAASLEAKLQVEVPELTEAFNNLRTALDKVVGWRISWRQYERGEVIDSESSEEFIEELGATALVNTAVRGPAQYHQNEGWIVGSLIGADRVMGGVSAWVEISQEQGKSQGVNFQLGGMYAIELTPPEQIA